MCSVNEIGINEFNGVKIEKFPAGYSSFSSFNPVLNDKEHLDKTITTPRNGKRGGKKIKVDGVIYDSMRAADKALGLQNGAVSLAYRRGNKQICGKQIEAVKDEI